MSTERATGDAGLCLRMGVEASPGVMGGARGGDPGAQPHHHLDVPVVNGHTADVGGGLPVGDAFFIQLTASQDEACGDGGLAPSPTSQKDAYICRKSPTHPATAPRCLQLSSWPPALEADTRLWPYSRSRAGTGARPPVTFSFKTFLSGHWSLEPGRSQTCRHPTCEEVEPWAE